MPPVPDPGTAAGQAPSGPSLRFERGGRSGPAFAGNPRAVRRASIGHGRPAGRGAVEQGGAPRGAAGAGRGAARRGSRLAWWILASLLVHGVLGGLFEGPATSGAATPARDLSLTLAPAPPAPAGDSGEGASRARASPPARPAAASAPGGRPRSAPATSASGPREGPARRPSSLSTPTTPLAADGRRTEHARADIAPDADDRATPDPEPAPPLAAADASVEHAAALAPPDRATATTATPDPEPAPPLAAAGASVERAAALASPDRATATTATPDPEPAPPLAAAGASVERAAALASPDRATATTATPVAGNPAPRYPRAARRRGIEGRLVLQVLVDARGAARSVEVFATSGHGLLDEAARAAVRRWRFVPGRREGRAAPSVVRVPVTFRLDRAS